MKYKINVVNEHFVIESSMEDTYSVEVKRCHSLIWALENAFACWKKVIEKGDEFFFFEANEESKKWKVELDVHDRYWSFYNLKDDAGNKELFDALSNDNSKGVMVRAAMAIGGSGRFVVDFDPDVKPPKMEESQPSYY